MKKLGDLVLPDAVEWTDKHAYSPVAQSAARTLGGGNVIYTQALTAGRPVTLEAREGVLWLSQAEVDAVMAMADQAGAQFALVWEAEQYTVMFRHHEPPAVGFTPIWPHHDKYFGTIKLITV